MARPLLRFVHGDSTLELNDGVIYALHPEFAPPPVALSPTFSGGGSANQRGGQEKISESAVNTSFSFGLTVYASSSERQMSDRLRNLRNFVGAAGDADMPLYLEFKADGTVADYPLWGQDGWLRYQVEHGGVTIDPSYLSGVRFSHDVDCEVTVTLRPYALGLDQVLLSATGGVIIDRYGSDRPRGVITPEATTNYFTNPVFGHATYTNGWTIGSSLVADDVANILPDTTVSAMLTAQAATNNTFVQAAMAFPAQTVMVWAIVKLPDESAPTSADMQMHHNGSDLTTTFTALGGGLYTAEASFTGLGMLFPVTLGLTVKNGRTIVVGAMQAELKEGYKTPLCYGDLLGCAWAGTAHDSTSTRTVARLRRATGELISIAQGCVRIGVKWAGINGLGVHFLWDTRDGTHAASLRVSYSAPLETITFHDGTNQATYQDGNAEGELMLYHFVWGPSGLVIYRNGVSVGTNATYTPPSVGAHCYVGSDYANTYNFNGTILGFATFDRELTAAQVLSDYTNLSPLLSANERIDAVPFVWTKDGDDIVDNCTDTAGSTGAPHHSYAVCDGIPGTVPARTLIDGSASTSGASADAVWLSLFDADKYIDPAVMLYIESADENADATCSGGYYFDDTVATSNVSLGSLAVSREDALRELMGREFYLLMRVYDAGSGLRIKSYISWQLDTPIADNTVVAADTTWRLFLSAVNAIPMANEWALRVKNPATMTLYAYADRAVGTGAARFDFAQIMVKPIVKIYDATINNPNFIYAARESVYVTSSQVAGHFAHVTGDVLELIPDRCNILLSQVCGNGAAHVIADTLTYNQIIVAPRYELI